MTRIERPSSPISPPVPGHNVAGRLGSMIWRNNRWLRRLIGLALGLLIIASGLAYFGIVNVPMISRVVYQPIMPVRDVSAATLSVSPDALSGQLTVSEGQLTMLLQQLQRLPGSTAVFYNLQVAIESGRVEVYGRLFQADGFYRFTAQAEPQAIQGDITFVAKQFHVQRVGLPASYIQPLFNQLATVSHTALLNAPVSQVSAEPGQIRFTIKPTTIR